MPTTKSERFSAWFTGVLCPLYTSHFVSSWGRHTFEFGIGLYLTDLAGDDAFLLTAVFGFLTCGSILLLGGILGNWIDKNGRLKVMRISILINKISVIVCVVAICIMLVFEVRLSKVARTLCVAFIIIMATLVMLSNMCYKFIAVEKDWFVVVSKGNKEKLASLNAGSRALDLIANTIAPIAIGNIMTYGSKLSAGIVIVCWHLAALFVELILMSRVYILEPALSKKRDEHETTYQTRSEFMAKLHGGESDEEMDLEEFQSIDLKDHNQAELKLKPVPKDKSCLQFLADPFILWVKAWRVYGKQSILLAAVSLSLLYPTVLGFDGITTGYIYRNGISESMTGLCLGLGSICGVFGSFLFTRIRICLGLERTGFVSFTSQVSFLSLCVFSIWLPGSLFNPTFQIVEPVLANCTNQTAVNLYSCSETGGSGPSTSIIVFLIGIILSRAGLWMSDLTVSQIIQENVTENERGIVNGGQNSLNMLLETFKFAVIIILPKLQTFGFLIIGSFSFIIIATCFYVAYVFKISGKSVSKCLRGEIREVYHD